MAKQRCVIFDIDSTISDTTKRQNLALEKKWEQFYLEAENDDPVEQTIELTKFYTAKGYHVVLLTGRPSRFRGLTEKWLKAHGVKYDELIMSEEFSCSTRMKDVDYKFHRFAELAFDYDIWAVFEDRKSNIEMFRDNGVFVFAVEDHKF